MRYHINNQGVVGACTAEHGGCPFTATGHFDSPAEARTAYEVGAGTQVSSGLRKPSSSAPTFVTPLAVAKAVPLAARFVAQAQRYASSGQVQAPRLHKLYSKIAAAPERWLSTAIVLKDRPKWAAEAFVGDLSEKETKALGSFLSSNNLLDVEFEKGEHYSQVVGMLMDDRVKQAQRVHSGRRAELSSIIGYELREEFKQQTPGEKSFVEGSGFASGVPAISRVFDDGSVMHMAYGKNGEAHTFKSAKDSPYGFSAPATQLALRFEARAAELLSLQQVARIEETRKARAESYKNFGSTLPPK